MASIIGVETLQHTNGTTAATIKSDGTFYPTGGIVQVKQTVKTDVFTTTSTSYTDLTGLSVAITPKSTSSKIMVEFHIGAHNTSVATVAQYKIVRGSTDIGLGDSGNGTQGTIGCTMNASRGETVSMKYLDSPATTSEVTYKIQAKVHSGTLDVNRRPSQYSSISTITVTEIAG